MYDSAPALTNVLFRLVKPKVPAASNEPRNYDFAPTFLGVTCDASNCFPSFFNEDQVGGRMPKRARVKGDFLKRRALMLPEEARYDYLLPASDCMMNPSVRPITVRSLWRLYSSHG